MSSGFRLVTSPLSTTTSSSTQLPPAFRTSVLIAGHEVSVRPRTTPASIKTHGPWQIAATGVPSLKKWRVDSKDSGGEGSVSGVLNHPPGIRASEYFRLAASTLRSAPTISPLFARL